MFSKQVKRFLKYIFCNQVREVITQVRQAAQEPQVHQDLLVHLAAPADLADQADQEVPVDITLAVSSMIFSTFMTSSVLYILHQYLNLMISMFDGN